MITCSAGSLYVVSALRTANQLHLFIMFDIICIKLRVRNKSCRQIYLKSYLFVSICMYVHFHSGFILYYSMLAVRVSLCGSTTLTGRSCPALEN